MLAARLRLVSLWMSQVARVLADWCLRVVAFLIWSRASEGNGDAWHVPTAVFIAPFILLAPLNGCINNGLLRRWVLAGSAAFTLLVGAAFAVGQWEWMLWLRIVALGSAVYSPARYAMLPAVAEDTHIPLPRVNGWNEMGGASAIVGGAALSRKRISVSLCWTVPDFRPPGSPVLSFACFPVRSRRNSLRSRKMTRPDSGTKRLLRVRVRQR